MLLNKKAVIKYIILSALFFIGISLGLLFWNKITLPFQNPWGITGTLTEIRYNPSNDTVRFVVFLLFPVLILSVVYLLNIRKINNICFEEDSKNVDNNLSSNLPSAGKKIFAGILILFAILAAINIPTFHASGRFDTYHEGESLGPGVSYMAGKAPYKDFLFLHGIYENPLRSVIAFRLFGRSIGSVRTLESIMKILIFVLLSVFMIQLYHGNYLYSFTAMMILVLLYITPIFHMPQLMFIKTRDITIFSFLITIPFLQDSIKRSEIDPKKLFIISFLFSFIPLASFGYSVDRGYYLLATYLIVLPIIYFSFFHRSPYRTHFLISSFLGLLSAILLMGFLLRGGFFEFFRYTFLIMSRYRELQAGFVYPIYEIPFLTICILIAANTYWLTFRFIQEFHLNNRRIKPSIKSFIEKYLIEFCLLILSIFLFRNALGRSDWSHVTYSSSITYILSIYIVIKYYLHNVLHKYGFNKKWAAYSLTPVIIVSSMVGIYQIYNKNLLIENFPFKIEDSEFIPENYKATISFLKNNLNDDEEFLTMTNEPSWYYFVDKPCPTRFLIAAYAMPYFYQKEVVKDLKNGNVKFILYKNNHWANRIDGFNNEIRLPIVFDYIKQSYVFFKKIDDNELWIKK